MRQVYRNKQLMVTPLGPRRGVPLFRSNCTRGAQKGVTLRYRGEKFTQDDLSRVQSRQTGPFIDLFASIGALAQSSNLTPRQTTALLRSTSEREHQYATRRVEDPGRGGDEAGLQLQIGGETRVYNMTMRLCEMAHAPIGKSRILNELGQPVVKHNRQGIRGQLAIFDYLHDCPWGVGLALSASLDEQGFRYVRTPDFTPEEYEDLCDQIEAGEYSLQSDGDAIVGKYRLETMALTDIIVSPSRTSPHASKLVTKPKTKLGREEQSGFVLHRICAPISKTYTDGLLKLFRLAQTGWYMMKESDQDVVLSGVCFENSDQKQTLMTQNHSLNAMAAIFPELEKVSGFTMIDRLKSNLSKLAQRLRAKLRNHHDLKEAFLCGTILNEMVQSLRQDNVGTQRTWPDRLKARYADNLNGAKAVVHAFELVDSMGESLLRDDGMIATEQPTHDEPINATLVPPELNNPKFVAAIVSAGILVTEQCLLVQILQKIVAGENEVARGLLVSIFGDELAVNITRLARCISEDGKHPLRLGRQFAPCDELVNVFRAHFNTCLLSQYLVLISENGQQTPGGDVLKALDQLSEASHMLTRFVHTTSPEVGGRGTVAGLALARRRLIGWRLASDCLGEN